MGTDRLVLSVNTIDNNKNLQHFNDLFDFSNLDEDHKLLSDKNTNYSGNFIYKTRKNKKTDDFICLRSQPYSFRCNDENTNKL